MARLYGTGARLARGEVDDGGAADCCGIAEEIVRGPEQQQRYLAGPARCRTVPRSRRAPHAGSPARGTQHPRERVADAISDDLRALPLGAERQHDAVESGDYRTQARRRFDELVEA